MIKHLHHIIPKHIGGSDDPSNLIELTIEEHAEAHRLLYEQHGRWQDRVAWLSLSGIMKDTERIYEILKNSKLIKPLEKCTNVVRQSGPDLLFGYRKYSSSEH